MTLNLLHINLSKCCHLVFSPKTRLVDQPHPKLELKINGTIIKRVPHTKFLGITIDEELSWDQHLTQTKRKLYHSISTLKNIRKHVPPEIHINLYHSLFESHLVYGISSLGGIASSKIDSIFTIQKKAVRILFGDLEAYKAKFMTCARVRSLDDQILGEEFFRREHTKPLFKSQNILTIHNLYFFHCFMEVFKILKFHYPISLYNLYTFSSRTCLTHKQLIPPHPNKHFIYKSSRIWNTVRSKLGIGDLSISASTIKASLKNALHRNQHCHDEVFWLPSHDFDISKI